MKFILFYKFNLLKSRTPSFLKCLSFALVISFLAQDLAFAAGSEPLSFFHQAKQPFTKKIYIIQDAHLNLSAQKNIAKTIDELITQEKIKIVFLEAGTGDDSLSYLRPKAIGDRRKAKQIADSFLQKGTIQGPDYLDLISDKPFKLWGVEDKALYFEGLGLYRDLKLERDFVEAYLERVERTASFLKAKIFNERLLRFDTNKTQFDSGQMLSADYFSYLVREAKSLGISFGDLSQIQVLSRLTHLEKVLKKNNTASKNYLKRVRKLDLDELLREKSLLEDRIFENIVQTSDERRLSEIGETLHTLQKLTRLNLEPGDYKAIRENPKQFSMKKISGDLNGMISGLHKGFENAVYLEPRYEKFVKKAKTFYALTLKRDHVFVKNTLSKMKSENETKAILVAGGFHSEHLKRLFADKEVDCEIIQPRVLAETNVRKYENLLLSQLPPKNAAPIIARFDALKIQAPSALWNVQPAANLVLYPAQGGRLSVKESLESELKVIFSVVTDNTKASRGARLGWMDWVRSKMRAYREEWRAIQKERTEYILKIVQSDPDIVKVCENSKLGLAADEKVLERAEQSLCQLLGMVVFFGLYASPVKTTIQNILKDIEHMKRKDRSRSPSEGARLPVYINRVSALALSLLLAACGGVAPQDAARMLKKSWGFGESPFEKYKKTVGLKTDASTKIDIILNDYLKKYDNSDSDIQKVRIDFFDALHDLLENASTSQKREIWNQFFIHWSGLHEEPLKRESLALSASYAMLNVASLLIKETDFSDPTNFYLVGKLFVAFGHIKTKRNIQRSYAEGDLSQSGFQMDKFINDIIIPLSQKKWAEKELTSIFNAVLASRYLAEGMSMGDTSRRWNLTEAAYQMLLTNPLLFSKDQMDELTEAVRQDISGLTDDTIYTQKIRKRAREILHNIAIIRSDGARLAAAEEKMGTIEIVAVTDAQAPTMDSLTALATKNAQHSDFLKTLQNKIDFEKGKLDLKNLRSIIPDEKPEAPLENFPENIDFNLRRVKQMLILNAYANCGSIRGTALSTGLDSQRVSNEIRVEGVDSQASARERIEVNYSSAYLWMAKQEVLQWRELEKMVIIGALYSTGDFRGAAAIRLGIDQRTLYKKLKLYEIDSLSDAEGFLRKTQAALRSRKEKKFIEDVCRYKTKFIQTLTHMGPESIEALYPLVQEKFKADPTLKTNPEFIGWAIAIFSIAAAKTASDKSLDYDSIRTFIGDQNTDPNSLPNEKQIEAALLLLENRALVTMRMSEGKSLSLVLAAYLKMLFGYRVEIHDFNIPLASRNSAVAEAILNRLGFKTASLTETNGAELARKADFIHGTYDQFMFRHMIDRFSLKYFGKSQSSDKKKWVFLDEAEEPLWDEAYEPRVFADPTEEMDEDLKGIYIAVNELATRLLDEGKVKVIWVEEEGQFRRKLDIELDETRRAQLAELSKRDVLQKFYSDPEFPRELLDIAIQARLFYKEGEQYFSTSRAKHSSKWDQKITLRNESTGDRQEHRVIRFFQPFLEIKEGKKVMGEAVARELLTPHYFYRNTLEFSAVIGVLDSKRAAALEALYGATVRQVKPKYPNNRTVIPEEYFLNEKEKIAHFVDAIRVFYETGRPILLNTRSPEEAEMYRDALEAENERQPFLKGGTQPLQPIRVINGRDEVSDALNWNRIGDSFSITITAQVASRGAEIKLDPKLYKPVEAEFRGKKISVAGLVVLSTHYSKSLLTALHLEGRAGRRGKPGVFHFADHIKGNVFLTERVPGELQQYLSTIEGSEFDSKDKVIPMLFELARERALNETIEAQVYFQPLYNRLIDAQTDFATHARIKLSDPSLNRKTRADLINTLKSKSAALVNHVAQAISRKNLDLFNILMLDFEREIKELKKDVEKLSQQAGARLAAWANLIFKYLFYDDLRSRLRGKKMLSDLGFEVIDQEGHIRYKAGYEPPVLKCDLVMIPHGNTYGNSMEVFQGQNEGPLARLDDKGKSQAWRGAQELWQEYQRLLSDGDPGKGYVFLTSPLFRARETASFQIPRLYHLGLKRAIDVELEMRAKEINFGDWGGKKIDELDPAQQKMAQAYKNNSALIAPRNGESFPEFMVRVRKFIDEINQRYPGKTVFVYGHGMFTRVLKVLLKTQDVETTRDYIHFQQLRFNRGSPNPIQSGARLAANVLSDSRNRMIGAIQPLIDELSKTEQTAGFSGKPTVYALLGHQDLKAFEAFAQMWNKRFEAGDVIPIVITGGIGRATQDLKDLMLRNYAYSFKSRDRVIFKRLLKNEQSTESELIEFILTHTFNMPTEFQGKPVIYRDTTPTPNTVENLKMSRHLIAQAVSDYKLDHTAVSLVTTPPHNRRAFLTALKVFEEQIKNEKWSLIAEPVYPPDLNGFFDDAELERFVGFALGYPKRLHPKNQWSEFDRIVEYGTKASPDLIFERFDAGEWTPARTRALREEEFNQFLRQREGIAATPRFRVDTSALNDEELSKKAADRFIELAIQKLRSKKDAKFFVALAGGDTPVKFYKLLTKKEYYTRFKPGEMQRIVFFLGEERGPGADEPGANEAMVRSCFNFLSIKGKDRAIDQPKFFSFYDGNWVDVDAQKFKELVASYEIKRREVLAENGNRFDLTIWGIGSQANMGAIFPGSELLKKRYDPGYAVTGNLMSLTPEAFFDSKHAMVMMSGRHKRKPLYRVLKDLRSEPERKQYWLTQAPARLLWKHPEPTRVDFFVDKEALRWPQVELTRTLAGSDGRPFQDHAGQVIETRFKVDLRQGPSNQAPLAVLVHGFVGRGTWENQLANFPDDWTVAAPHRGRVPLAIRKMGSEQILNYYVGNVAHTIRWVSKEYPNRPIVLVGHSDANVLIDTLFSQPEIYQDVIDKISVEIGSNPFSFKHRDHAIRNILDFLKSASAYFGPVRKILEPMLTVLKWPVSERLPWPVVALREKALERYSGLFSQLASYAPAAATFFVAPFWGSFTQGKYFFKMLKELGVPEELHYAISQDYENMSTRDVLEELHAILTYPSDMHEKANAVRRKNGTKKLIVTSTHDRLVDIHNLREDARAMSTPLEIIDEGSQEHSLLRSHLPQYLDEWNQVVVDFVRGARLSGGVMLDEQLIRFEKWMLDLFSLSGEPQRLSDEGYYWYFLSGERVYDFLILSRLVNQAKRVMTGFNPDRVLYFRANRPHGNRSRLVLYLQPLKIRTKLVKTQPDGTVFLRIDLINDAKEPLARMILSAKPSRVDEKFDESPSKKNLDSLFKRDTHLMGQMPSALEPIDRGPITKRMRWNFSQESLDAQKILNGVMDENWARQMIGLRILARASNFFAGGYRISKVENLHFGVNLEVGEKLVALAAVANNEIKRDEYRNQSLLPMDVAVFRPSQNIEARLEQSAKDLAWWWDNIETPENERWWQNPSVEAGAVWDHMWHQFNVAMEVNRQKLCREGKIVRVEGDRIFDEPVETVVRARIWKIAENLKAEGPAPDAHKINFSNLLRAAIFGTDAERDAAISELQKALLIKPNLFDDQVKEVWVSLAKEVIDPGIVRRAVIAIQTWVKGAQSTPENNLIQLLEHFIRMGFPEASGIARRLLVYVQKVQSETGGARLSLNVSDTDTERAKRAQDVIKFYKEYQNQYRPFGSGGALFDMANFEHIYRSFLAIEKRYGCLKDKRLLDFGAGDLRVGIFAEYVFGMKVSSIEISKMLSKKSEALLENARAKKIAQPDFKFYPETDAFNISWSDADLVFYYYTEPEGDEAVHFRSKFLEKRLQMKNGSLICFLVLTGMFEELPGLRPDKEFLIERSFFSSEKYTEVRHYNAEWYLACFRKDKALEVLPAAARLSGITLGTLAVLAVAASIANILYKKWQKSQEAEIRREAFIHRLERNFKAKLKAKIKSFRNKIPMTAIFRLAEETVNEELRLASKENNHRDLRLLRGILAKMELLNAEWRGNDHEDEEDVIKKLCQNGRIGNTLRSPQGIELIRTIYRMRERIDFGETRGARLVQKSQETEVEVRPGSSEDDLTLGQMIRILIILVSVPMNTYMERLYFSSTPFFYIWPKVFSDRGLAYYENLSKENQKTLVFVTPHELLHNPPPFIVYAARDPFWILGAAFLMAWAIGTGYLRLVLEEKGYLKLKSALDLAIWFYVWAAVLAAVDVWNYGGTFSWIHLGDPVVLSAADSAMYAGQLITAGVAATFAYIHLEKKFKSNGARLTEKPSHLISNPISEWEFGLGPDGHPAVRSPLQRAEDELRIKNEFRDRLEAGFAKKNRWFSIGFYQDTPSNGRVRFFAKTRKEEIREYSYQVVGAGHLREVSDALARGLSRSGVSRTMALAGHFYRVDFQLVPGNGAFGDEIQIKVTGSFSRDSEAMFLRILEEHQKGFLAIIHSNLANRREDFREFKQTLEEKYDRFFRAEPELKNFIDEIHSDAGITEPSDEKEFLAYLRYLSERIKILIQNSAGDSQLALSRTKQLIRVEEDHKFASSAAIAIITKIESLQKSGKSVNIVFATGNTMVQMLDYMARFSQDIDWSRVQAYHLDEYAGLSPSHPSSFAAFLRKHLFSRVKIPEANIHYIDGSQWNVPGHLERYMKNLKDNGGADIGILGVGLDGHLAFNEPPRFSGFNQSMQIVDLNESTIAANEKDYPEIRKAPRAITMGMADIAEFKNIFFMANGEKKAEIVARGLQGPVTESVPVSMLQRMDSVIYMLDEPAASKLKFSMAGARLAEVETLRFLEGVLMFWLVIESIVLHEVAHAYAALKAGDVSAWMAGQISWKPWRFMSGASALTLVITGLLGVPATLFFAVFQNKLFNPGNGENKIALAKIALAGPIMNLILYGVFAGLYLATGYWIFQTVAHINLVFGLANMLPLGPLDGQKVFRALVPDRFMRFFDYGFIFSGALLLLGLIIYDVSTSVGRVAGGDFERTVLGSKNNNPFALGIFAMTSLVCGVAMRPWFKRIYTDLSRSLGKDSRSGDRFEFELEFANVDGKQPRPYVFKKFITVSKQTILPPLESHHLKMLSNKEMTDFFESGPPAKVIYIEPNQQKGMNAKTRSRILNGELLVLKGSSTAYYFILPSEYVGGIGEARMMSERQWVAGTLGENLEGRNLLSPSEAGLLMALSKILRAPVYDLEMPLGKTLWPHRQIGSLVIDPDGRMIFYLNYKVLKALGRLDEKEAFLHLQALASFFTILWPHLSEDGLFSSEHFYDYFLKLQPAFAVRISEGARLAANDEDYIRQAKAAYKAALREALADPKKADALEPLQLRLIAAYVAEFVRSAAKTTAHDIVNKIVYVHQTVDRSGRVALNRAALLKKVEQLLPEDAMASDLKELWHVQKKDQNVSGELPLYTAHKNRLPRAGDSDYGFGADANILSLPNPELIKAKAKIYHDALLRAKEILSFSKSHRDADLRFETLRFLGEKRHEFIVSTISTLPKWKQTEPLVLKKCFEFIERSIVDTEELTRLQRDIRNILKNSGPPAAARLSGSIRQPVTTSGVELGEQNRGARLSRFFEGVAYAEPIKGRKKLVIGEALYTVSFDGRRFKATPQNPNLPTVIIHDVKAKNADEQVAQKIEAVVIRKVNAALGASSKAATQPKIVDFDLALFADDSFERDWKKIAEQMALPEYAHLKFILSDSSGSFSRIETAKTLALSVGVAGSRFADRVSSVNNEPLVHLAVLEPGKKIQRAPNGLSVPFLKLGKGDRVSAELTLKTLDAATDAHKLREIYKIILGEELSLETLERILKGDVSDALLRRYAMLPVLHLEKSLAASRLASQMADRAA